MSVSTFSTIILMVLAIILLISGNKREFWQFGVGVFLLGISAMIFVCSKTNDSSYKTQEYTEVSLLDSNHYMQCINGIKVLVNKDSTSSTIWLNLDGKPESCATIRYTGYQIELPKNKDKHFISI